MSNKSRISLLVANELPETLTIEDVLLVPVSAGHRRFISTQL